MNLVAHFPQLQKLEKIGLKPIDTLEKLVDFMIGQRVFIGGKSGNPFDRVKEGSRYHRFQMDISISFLCWLKEYTCEGCGIVNPERSLHFHHIDPKLKVFSISSKASMKNKIELFKEVMKCAYLCEYCHYKYHSYLGDANGNFEIIDRRRRAYIHNMLGVRDGG